MIVEPASHFFWLLCSAESGDFLCVSDGALGEQSRADDAACWELAADGATATSVVGGVEVELADAAGQASYNPAGEQGKLCTVSLKGSRSDATYMLVRGPPELPSVCLAQMQSEGWTVLPQLIHPDTVASMHETFYAEGFFSRIGDLVNSTESVAKTAVHPVMLWIMEEYIRGPIHVGGFNVAITPPVPPDTVSGSGFGQGKGGWHCAWPHSLALLSPARLAALMVCLLRNKPQRTTRSPTTKARTSRRCRTTSASAASGSPASVRSLGPLAHSFCRV